MDSARIALGRLFDVRTGEWRAVILAFAVLLLTSTGYTVLETARDALLVTNLPQREFGLAYIAVAVFVLPVASLLTFLGQRFDARRVLVTTLVASALASVVWYSFPVSHGSVVALYVLVGLVSSSVYPQFWLLMGGGLTVGQSRRLFGPIGSAAVVGSAVGASMAAALVVFLPLHALPIASASLFVLAAATSLAVGRPPPRVPDAKPPDTGLGVVGRAIAAEPFLRRVGLLVVLTTATALSIDYFFKWSIARSLPHADRGVFVARYYVVINAAALVMQLFVGGALVRRLGVALSLEVTPSLSLLGAGAAFVGAGAVGPVLVLKGIDASLRNSLNRLTTELVYLPVSPSGRERAKPFMDGALPRITQAVTAAFILGLTRMHALSPPIFAGVVVLFAAAWLVATITARRGYLAQLRQSVASDGRGLPGGTVDTEELDMAAAELVVESLGSDDPLMVRSAMNTLARHGRQRLIPALMLRHDDEGVLRRALEILGASSRSDWHKFAVDLLTHPGEDVRLAAARALATHGKLEARKLDADASPSVHGYATLFGVLETGTGDALDDPRIVTLLAEDEGGLGRLGVLAAIADLPSSPRLTSLLEALAVRGAPAAGPSWSELLARATVRQNDVAMIPHLVALLARREGRESVREALAALGEPARAAVAKAFEDPEVDRKVRVHLPRTLAVFGTKWAADELLSGLEHIRDGRVRYRALRALGRLVGRGDVRVDRVRVEKLARANLVSYFQLLGLRAALGEPPPESEAQVFKTYTLFVGLLDDKVRQSRERAFRLLKIAHPREDIRRVYLACLSSDRRARANASEFLDALLRRRDQVEIRELFRLISDDLPHAEQARRALRLLDLPVPAAREDAVRIAVADPDIKLAALAALYAAAVGEVWLETALSLRPALASTARDMFQEALLHLRTAHA